jgi:prevent-host-death family protein
MKWQLQEAKARFSQIVRMALDEGPQTVTRHGEDAVVIISAAEFRRLKEPKLSAKEALASGPDVDLETPPREVDMRDVDL